MQKVTKNIFPEDLLEMPSGDLYELVSIINHNGANLNSGHYVTFVKKDSNWFECNDQTYNDRMKDQIISDNNFVYLYQKRNINQNSLVMETTTVQRGFVRQIPMRNHFFACTIKIGEERGPKSVLDRALWSDKYRYREAPSVISYGFLSLG